MSASGSPKVLSAKNLRSLGDDSSRRTSRFGLDATSGKHDDEKSVSAASAIGPGASRRFSMFGGGSRKEGDNKSELGTDDGGHSRKFGSLWLGGGSKKVDDDKSSTHGGGHSVKSSKISRGFSFSAFFSKVEEESDDDRSSVPSVSELPSIDEKRGKIEVRKLARMKTRGLGEDFWRQRERSFEHLPLPDLPAVRGGGTGQDDDDDDDDGKNGPSDDPIIRRIDEFIRSGRSPGEIADLKLRLLVHEEIKRRDAPKYCIVSIIDGVKRVPYSRPSAPPPGHNNAAAPEI